MHTSKHTSIIYYFPTARLIRRSGISLFAKFKSSGHNENWTWLKWHGPCPSICVEFVESLIDMWLCPVKFDLSTLDIQRSKTLSYTWRFGWWDKLGHFWSLTYTFNKLVRHFRGSHAPPLKLNSNANLSFLAKIKQQNRESIIVSNSEYV